MTKRASPGEGRPYQRSEDGRWAVVVRDADNRRRYLYAWSKPEAIGKRDDWNAGVKIGLAPPSGRLTVGRHLADWLEDRRGKVRGSTYVDYEAHVRLHLGAIENLQLVRLTPNDVRRLLRGRLQAGCSPSTVAKTLTILRMGLGQAVTDGLVPRNVAKLVRPPEVPRSPILILTADECRRLIATPHDLRALWALLVGTGLRLGEALGLGWTDIDLVDRRITVQRTLRSVDRRVRAEGQARLELREPKTDASRRTIIVPSFVGVALEELAHTSTDRPRNVQRLVFTTPSGTPFDQRNVSRAWADARREAELPTIRIHDLRHTAASLMLAQGASLHDVMKALGHSSIAMTANTYGHLVEGRSRELADGMDRMIGGAG